MPSVKPPAKKPRVDPREAAAAARLKVAQAKRDLEERKRTPPQANPLDSITTTGNTETDDAAETDVVIGAVERSRATMKANMDQGYWLCLVFQSRAQVQAFLDRTGWREYLDSSGVYADGKQVAAALKVALPDDMRHDSPHAGDQRLVREVGIFRKEKPP